MPQNVSVKLDFLEMPMMIDLDVNQLNVTKMKSVPTTKFALITNAKLLVEFPTLVQNLPSVYLIIINPHVNANLDLLEIL